MSMDKIIVCALFLLLFLSILCICCYLTGYKKGAQDMARFHNKVWKVAVMRCLNNDNLYLS